jgi:hypothetical protein
MVTIRPSVGVSVALMEKALKYLDGNFYLIIKRNFLLNIYSVILVLHDFFLKTLSKNNF